MEAHNFPFLHAEEFPRVPFVIDGISSRFIKENKVIPLDVREKTGFGVKAVITLDTNGSFRYLSYKCPNTGSLQ